MSRVRQPHGTPAGYRRHRRAGEEPCQECAQAQRDAWAEVSRSRYADSRDRQAAANRRYRERHPTCLICQRSIKDDEARVETVARGGRWRREETTDTPSDFGQPSCSWRLKFGPLKNPRPDPEVYERYRVAGSTGTRWVHPWCVDHKPRIVRYADGGWAYRGSDRRTAYDEHPDSCRYCANYRKRSDNRNRQASYQTTPTWEDLADEFAARSGR